jgi:hypothetical protein
MRNEPSGTKLKYFGEREMKNTITAATMAIVLGFGATFANAGIIVTDRADGIIVTDRAERKCESTSKSGIIVTDFMGIFRAILGIIVTDRPEKQECTSDVQKTGIIVTDRADSGRGGIIVTD